MTVRNNTVGAYYFVPATEAEANAHSTSTGGTTPTPPSGTTYPIGYYNSVSLYAQSWEHPVGLNTISKYLPSIDIVDRKKLVDVFETNARSLEDHLDVAYLKTSGGTVFGATTLAGDVNLLGTVRIEELPLLSLLPPTGSVTIYAGLTIPAGWLECNGQAVLRATYPSLYANINTAYGAGDGSTTFNIPDLRGRMPLGEVTGPSTRGQTGGEATVALTAAQSGLVGHNHVQTPHWHSQPEHTHTQTAHDHTQPVHSHTFTTGVGGSHSHTLPGAKQGLATAAHNGTTSLAAGMSVNTGEINLSTSTEPTHSHTGTTNDGGDDVTGSGGVVETELSGDDNTGSTTAENTSIAAANAAEAHNNMPPYQIFKFIIKT